MYYPYILGHENYLAFQLLLAISGSEVQGAQLTIGSNETVFYFIFHSQNYFALINYVLHEHCEIDFSLGIV